MHSKFSYTATSSTQTSGTQTISAAPTLLAEVGKYNLRVDACVVANPISCKVCSVEVTVTNPCLQTKITGPTQVQNFVVFAGHNQTSNSSYTFNDSISEAFTLSSDSMDFCGEKVFKFKINSGNTTLLSGNNSQNISFSPLSNSTIFGTLPAQILICMKDYSVNCMTIDFNVTTLGFKAPIIPSQNYQIYQTKLTIPVDPPFQILPQNFKFEPPLVSNLSAYVVSQESIQISTIDLKIYNLTQIRDQKWINFNSTSQSFTVFTDDKQFLGVWTIIIVQSLDQFPKVNPLSTFQLTVTPIFAQKQPPYFEPALKNQTVNICPGKQKVLWQFVIPNPIDPNNGTVTMKVALNPVYFTYNASKNLIYQNQEQKIPMNQTIRIKLLLLDEFNISATYSIEVEFQCKLEEEKIIAAPVFKNPKKTKNIKPKAYIKTIDLDGLLHIAFRQKMKIPENITKFLDGFVISDQKEQPGLFIDVIPGRLSDRKQLNFTSKVVNFTATELKIQLNFENLEMVSFHNLDRDQITVYFYDEELFVDTNENFMPAGVQLQPVYLPCLNTPAAIQKASQAATQVQQGITVFLVSNFALSFLITGILQQMLGSIRHLQIIIHALLLNVSYPSVPNVFFGALMNLLTFQIINLTDFFNKVLSLDPNSDGNNALNNQFNFMGYGAKYIIQNFGMLCFTIIITPALYLLVLCCQARLPKYMDKYRLSITRQMFFGSWIQLLNETYLFLGVCAMINCSILTFDQYGNTINSLCALFCVILINVFPLFVIIFYNIPKNYRKIQSNDEDFMARYGQILDGLNFYRMGQKNTLYPFFSLMRKLLLIYVVVFLQERPVFCIFTLIYLSLIMITLVGYIPPFKSKIENQLEIVNEIFVLIVCYCLFTLTDFLSDAPSREYVGYFLVATTLICILINFGAVSYTLVTQSCYKLKLKYREWKYFAAVKSLQNKRKQKWLRMLIERQEKQKQEHLRHFLTKNANSSLKQISQLSKFQRLVHIRVQQIFEVELPQEFWEQQKSLLKVDEQNLPKVEIVPLQTENFPALNQDSNEQLYSNKISEKGKSTKKDKRAHQEVQLQQDSEQNFLFDLDRFIQPDTTTAAKCLQVNQSELVIEDQQEQVELQRNNESLLEDSLDNLYETSVDMELGNFSRNQNQNNRQLIEAKPKTTIYQKVQNAIQRLKPKPTEKLVNSIFTKQDFNGLPLDNRMTLDKLNELKQLFIYTENNAPKNWEEVERKIHTIFSNCGCPQHLLVKAIKQFKLYNVDWKFAAAFNVDIDLAIAYRNGKVDKLIKIYIAQKPKVLARKGLTREDQLYFQEFYGLVDSKDNLTVSDKLKICQMVWERKDYQFHFGNHYDGERELKL